MRRESGSALVDYVVPTCVIGAVVGLGLFYLNSNGKMLNFIAATGGNTSVNSSTGKLTMGSISSSNVINEPNTGNQNQPDCDNAGLCKIEYGPYIFNGVPADFSKFVQQKGNSEGSNTIAGLMDQIAQQLLDKGDNEGVDRFTDLANLARFIASNQKIAETEATSCIGNANPQTCVNSKMFNNINISVPVNIQHLLSNYTSSDILRHHGFTTELSYARDFKTSDSALFNTWKTKNPALAMIDIYDSIKAQSKYSDLMPVVDQLMTAFNENMLAINHRVGGEKVPTITNPVTGSSENYSFMPPDSAMYDPLEITNPSNSVRSALIADKF